MPSLRTSASPSSCADCVTAGRKNDNHAAVTARPPAGAHADRPRMTRWQRTMWATLAFLMALVSACSAPSTPAAAPAPALASAADVEARLEALIPRLMAAGDVPGLTIGLV